MGEELISVSEPESEKQEVKPSNELSGSSFIVLVLNCLVKDIADIFVDIPTFGLGGSDAKNIRRS